LRGSCREADAGALSGGRIEDSVTLKGYLLAACLLNLPVVLRTSE
jgi:hypothetical protein